MKPVAKQHTAESLTQNNYGQYLEIAVSSLAPLFTYRCSTDACSKDWRGWCVEVPFGKRKVKGIIVGQSHTTTVNEEKLKTLEEAHFLAPMFLPEQFGFFEWISKYYSTPLSRILATAAPQLPTLKKEKHLLLIKEPTAPIRGSTIRQIIDTLKKYPSGIGLSEIKRHTPNCSSQIRKLKEQGIIEEFEVPITEWHNKKEISASDEYEHISLNSEQQAVYQKIEESVNQSTFDVHLIHGETGSGKTEIYIELARHASNQGRTVLLLVPEISLTPQLHERFERRLGRPVAVLHSGLGKNRRWQEWASLYDHTVTVAIGARSAIFAPLSDLGLIILDEEHDASFKQSDNLRYAAKELALVLARNNNCPLVLGSATPSLETFHAALSGKYQLHKVSSFQPKRNRFHVIDTSVIKRRDMASPSLSQPFVQLLKKHLENKSQAFILLNKRGFASYIHCSACKEIITCPNCSVTMTYYSKRNTLLCHYCGFHQSVPHTCPACHKEQCLDKLGSGTEKIEVELQELFPSARIERLDRESCSTLKEYESLLRRLREQAIDILVGTQMIAKGHDLPNVQFVGVVDSDVGIHFPDFRAAEKTYQLLTQVSGRAGRHSTAGDVVLQTRLPKHPSIKYTELGDYTSFARQELSARKTLQYPPFTYILRIIAATESQEKGVSILEELKRYADKKWSDSHSLHILGPAPCPIEKIKTRWRSHLLLKSARLTTLLEIQHRLKSFPLKDSDRLLFDLNPVDML